VTAPPTQSPIRSPHISATGMTRKFFFIAANLQFQSVLVVGEKVEISAES
jgi:hypothetical protein